MKFKLLAGAALAATFAASAVSAEVTPGWYGAIDIGWHDTEGMRFTETSVIPATHTDVNSTSDWLGFARIGYQFDAHWRVEVEGGYRDNRYKFAPLSPVRSGVFAKGDDTAMVNVLYDFDSLWTITPFIGVGAGANYPGGHTNEFAWQGLAGLSFAATDHLDIDLTYRYLDAGRIAVDCSSSGGPGCYGQTTNYKDNSVTIGLRYSFASPPPPPPPPAPPAFVAKDFVVYFPFDQFILTPEAQTVVQQASQYANDGHATRVVVVGHTDTSGGVAYNLRLSEKRAKAVADAMVGLGVPQTIMNVDWKGKTDLAVQTPDGVKEPLNRRSTISINF